jgi:hypothetical protein
LSARWKQKRPEDNMATNAIVLSAPTLLIVTIDGVIGNEPVLRVHLRRDSATAGTPLVTSTADKAGITVYL